MKRVPGYLLTLSLICVLVTACKRHDNAPPNTASAGNYFPLKTNDQWVYAISDVYYGADTLHVKVIGGDTLSNNQAGWALYYLDEQGFYNDTNYVFILHDTVFTYAYKNADSLTAKWILTDIVNNSWSGIDTADKYNFEAAVPSISAYGFTYNNIWNISRRDIQYNYSELEQLFFEDSIGMCFYELNRSIAGTTVINQEWHLISYQLN